MITQKIFMTIQRHVHWTPVAFYRIVNNQMNIIEIENTKWFVLESN